MIEHVPSFERLVNELSKLPSIGPKTAQRLSYYILRSPDQYVPLLSEALLQVKSRVRECPQCFSYTENEGLCHYCQDESRSSHEICVVEDPGDIAPIEASRAFRGRYHVLHGAISPLEGVTPHDLKIQALIERIDMGLKDPTIKVNEVILALDADLEGDTTVLYINKALLNKEVKITRIAHGVPIGGDIDYIDKRTLGRALENRVSL